MNKKIALFIGIGILVVGGVLGFLYKTKDAEKEITKLEQNQVGGKWNPYAIEDHHSVTISDFLASASKGEFIVKMSVTLDFDSEEAYYKFKGYSSIKEAEKGEEGKAKKDAAVTPMELKINDIIGNLMMNADEKQLSDHDKLKVYLKNGINKNLGFDEPAIKEIYVENFVMQ
ncbi:flagellar basal body-associated FliL family protein [Bacillus toyonensis]|uniref:flagellar basal body-associated FliL family protein n=1 Tax=Bacillus toyonensis TaxID=155322 RepID=UPI002E1DD46D|nr:flagellar basal body-associated FliL family protein [Bacillus toyonensis]